LQLFWLRHLEISADGAAIEHWLDRLVNEYASRDDLTAVIDVLRALRFYMALPPAAIARVEGV
jgi:hypothetical protein